MRRPTFLAALLVGAFLAAGATVKAPVAREDRAEPAEGTPFPVNNGDFERPRRQGERCPERWDCTMHANPESFKFTLDEGKAASGKQSLKIVRVIREPWAVVTQTIRMPALAALRGKRVRISALVLVEPFEGEGDGGGPWFIVHGTRVDHANGKTLVKATRDWQRVSVEATVDPAAIMLEFGATLEGAGPMWVDDIRLEVL